MPKGYSSSVVEKPNRTNGQIELWVRFSYYDVAGNRKEKMRRADDRTHAKRLIKDLERDLLDNGSQSLDADAINFAQLAKTYQEKKLFPAKMVKGRKVGGVKSLAPALSALVALADYFDKRRVKAIRHSDVEGYKLHRLETPTIHGKQRQISSVNRELELLRAMLRFAVRQGWLARSPFEMGDPLISKADENRRERTLSADEERRFLEACLKPDPTGRQRRLHLVPLFYAALDTGCRRGELFKLRWRDVDLASRTFTVIAENSKTARARTIGMTPRLCDELTRMWEKSASDETALVFGVTNTIKTAFKAVCQDAGIEDYHWHDGRHTATTRMVATGRPSAVIMKITGHTQHSTFARYVNPDTEAITSVADALGARNAEAAQANSSDETTELIN